MNSKVSRFVLIAAAVLVWGLIIFKVIGSFSDNEDEVNLVEQVMPDFNSKQIPDTFNLLLSYSDPFLGGNFETKPVYCPKPIERIELSPKPEAMPKAFPKVKYHGLITNKQTNKLVAIININGKQYLAKQGAVLEEISLIKMHNDSILIANGQTKKWILK